MWRKIKIVLAISIVSFAGAMTLHSSSAQDTTRDDVGAQTATTRDDDDGFDLGWLGLAGLAGLAGLLPRDNRDRRDRTNGDFKR